MNLILELAYTLKAFLDQGSEKKLWFQNLFDINGSLMGVNSTILRDEELG